ncbi:MAG: hypothetical protein CSB44_08255 [Gammaproteobacteria bacterium]|nr:MAG: hypothetical protein CSB44_08255 [Gammaproteobacteria bacterium]
MKADRTGTADASASTPRRSKPPSVSQALARRDAALATFQRTRRQGRLALHRAATRPLNLLFPFVLGIAFTRLPKRIVMPPLPGLWPFLLHTGLALMKQARTQESPQESPQKPPPDPSTEPPHQPAKTTVAKV